MSKPLFSDDSDLSRFVFLRVAIQPGSETWYGYIEPDQNDLRQAIEDNYGVVHEIDDADLIESEFTEDSPLLFTPDSTPSEI